MFVYLAHPIDRAMRNAPSYKSAEAVRSRLIEMGVTVFSPGQGWGARAPLSADIQRVNDQILREASALVVCISSADRSLGVPWEMALANQWGVPLVVLTDIPRDTSAVLLSSGAEVFQLYDVERAAQRVAGRIEESDGRLVARWENMGGGVAPRQGKPGDAGFDLTYSGCDPLQISPGEMVNVEAGIGVEFPAGYWSLIVGRSSTFQRGLFVAPSVIDAGYRGPLFACVLNIGSEAQVVEPGERVAQVVPYRLVSERFRWAEGRLSDSVRGATGFGSTGR